MPPTYKQTMTQLWNKVAPTYSQVAPHYWNTFGHRLVELAHIAKGANVLDIGSGRGASLFPLREKVGEDGKITGIDISEAMVAECANEVTRQGLRNIELLTMDADHLHFPADSFDNILGGFVISYLLDTDPSLTEVMRVLKPGGEVGFSVWGVQQDTPWLTDLLNKHLHSMTPFKNTNPAAPRFDTVENVSAILAEAGFSNLRITEEDTVIRYHTKEEWWQELWTNATRRVLEKIANLDHFQHDAFLGLEKYRCGEDFHFTRTVIYAFGKK